MNEVGRMPSLRNFDISFQNFTKFPHYQFQVFSTQLNSQTEALKKIGNGKK